MKATFEQINEQLYQLKEQLSEAQARREEQLANVNDQLEQLQSMDRNTLKNKMKDEGISLLDGKTITKKTTRMDMINSIIAPIEQEVISEDSIKELQRQIEVLSRQVELQDQDQQGKAEAPKTTEKKKHLRIVSRSEQPVSKKFNIDYALIVDALRAQAQIDHVDLTTCKLDQLYALFNALVQDDPKDEVSVWFKNKNHADWKEFRLYLRAWREKQVGEQAPVEATITPEVEAPQEQATSRDEQQHQEAPEQTKALSTFVDELWYEDLAQRFAEGQEPQSPIEPKLEKWVEELESKYSTVEASVIQQEQPVEPAKVEVKKKAPVPTKPTSVSGTAVIGTEYVEETLDDIAGKKIPAGYLILYKKVNGAVKEDEAGDVEVQYQGRFVGTTKSILGAKRIIYRHVGPLKLPQGYSIVERGSRYYPHCNGQPIMQKDKEASGARLENAENHVFKHYKQATGKDFPIESANASQGS